MGVYQGGKARGIAGYGRVSTAEEANPHPNPLPIQGEGTVSRVATYRLGKKSGVREGAQFSGTLTKLCL
jgi:hypothetical protein